VQRRTVPKPLDYAEFRNAMMSRSYESGTPCGPIITASSTPN